MLAAAALCAAALVVEAAAQSSPPASDPDPVVALYDGGVVKESDLSREARFLAPREERLRETEGRGEADDRRDFARRIALRAAARRAVETEGRTADPRLAEAAHAAGRRWLLGRWREACYGYPLELPSEDRLLAELGPPRTLPERRRLSHLFLRAESADEVAAATARMAAWRSEVRTLAEFQDRAFRFSESQTAKRRGRLGTVRPGWLPAEAEKALYALPEGAMSEPIALRGGVHLFWIEKRFPAETVAPDRRLAKLRAEKAIAARDACRARRLAASELGVSADGPELVAGDRRLPAELVEGRPGETPEEARRRWIEDEVLYQSALAAGVPSAEERLHVRDLEGDVWLRDLVRERLAARLPEPTEEELRRRFDAEPGRYRSPRELAGRYLVARPPAGGDPVEFLDALSDLSGRLARGEAEWAEAGRHGRVESFARQPAFQVASLLGPFVFDQVKSLEAGEVSEPIQDGADFWLVAIDEDVPQRPLSFAEARPRLRAEARKEAAVGVQARVLGELLESVAFRFVEPE